MTRLVCLFAPVALVLASGCACFRECGEPDPTPTHTFGRDGSVEKAGGLFGTRKFCPMCEWAGTKCAACRAKECEACAACKDGCAAKGSAVKDKPTVRENVAKEKPAIKADEVDQPAPRLLPPQSMLDAENRREAEQMIKMLETKKIPLTPTDSPKPATANSKSKSAVKETEEPEVSDRRAGPISPYAPVREGPLLRTSR